MREKAEISTADISKTRQLAPKLSRFINNIDFGVNCPFLSRVLLTRILFVLRFQSSKSGKIYLHNDIRLLFSRKSIEVDTGIPYELKSFTEVPRNPKYSPRV